MTSEADSAEFLAENALDLRRRRAVVLVVDLVESVRLMAADEAGVIVRWEAFLSQVQSVILPATMGRLVKSLGDGLLMEFTQAPQAVSAVSAMHQWMTQHSSSLSNGRFLRLRAGIHATEIFDASIDIYGVGVNLAARIASLAEAGETIATVEVRDLLNDSMDADVEDLGECFLKHIDRPVRAYRLGPPRQALSMLSERDREVELSVALAVIPFSSRRVRGELEGIGDIVADGVIGQLSKSPALRVVSRLSTTHFRERSAPLSEIAARLGCRFVVSGTYYLDGDTVRLDAELADGTTGWVVWSGSSEGQWRDLLCANSELVHELADRLHRAVLEKAVPRAAARPLPTLQSYELFLGGVAMMHRASVTEFERSRQMLEALTERHRQIALPHAWLGKWYVLKAIQGGTADASDATAALDHTARALDLEPSSSLALAIEGFVHCHLKKDLDTADARLQEACALNPSEGFGWLFLAVNLAFKGETQRAVEAARHAASLSPMDPLRYYYESLMGSCEFGAGRHEEAIRLCEASRRRNRQHLSTLRILIAAHVALGRQEQACALAAELLTIRPGYTVTSYERNSVAAMYPFGQQIAKAMRLSGIP